VPALVNPVAEQTGHSFQSAFRISRPFVPTHRFSPTILPHSASISAALYDGAPQSVHRATGVGLLLMRSPRSTDLTPLSGTAASAEQKAADYILGESHAESEAE
jgi:hypothetical protein